MRTGSLGSWNDLGGRGRGIMRKWAHRLQSVTLSPGCNKRRGSLQVLKVVGATGILGNDVINFKEAERELPAVSACSKIQRSLASVVAPAPPAGLQGGARSPRQYFHRMAFPRVVVTPVSNSKSKGLAWWWHEGRVDRCPSLRAPVLFDQRADRRVPIRQLTESEPPW